MELEFDKEIDALMRSVGARGLPVGAGAAAHLDADELSAFAENAMPEKTRALHLAHLADCDRCRGVLSGIIAMSSDLESDTAAVTAAVAPVSAAAADVPWYRGLFAFPNLAYVMGGLVLVFGGLITVSLLRQNADNVSVSQTTEMEVPVSRTQVPQAGSAANAASNSNAQSLIPGEPTPQIGMADPRPELAPPAGAGATGNTPADQPAPAEGPAKNDAARITTDGVDTADVAKPVASAPAMAPPPAPAKDAERREDDKLEVLVTQESPKGTVAEKKRSDDGRARNSELSARQVQDLPRTQAGGVSKAKPGPTRDAQQPFPNRANNTFEVPETRRVGGKNFQFRNGAWYDTQYRGQSTNSVKRGSDEYRKLDAGLRTIVEGLYGVVVVVWQDKAYKIR